ncbi:unnamed protein product, partial [Amoebophrya sp. A25]
LTTLYALNATSYAFQRSSYIILIDNQDQHILLASKFKNLSSSKKFDFHTKQHIRRIPENRRRTNTALLQGSSAMRPVVLQAEEHKYLHQVSRFFESKLAHNRAISNTE